MDETGLPNEPKKCKVISDKGQKTLLIVPNSGQENTTVVGACSVSAINPQLTEKNACIFYRWGPLDPNYVIFEKSLDYLQIYFSLVQMP